MRTFTCKCGKITQETKQYMVTTDCCGVGYTKAIIQDNDGPAIVPSEIFDDKSKKVKVR